MFKKCSQEFVHVVVGLYASVHIIRQHLWS